MRTITAANARERLLGREAAWVDPEGSPGALAFPVECLDVSLSTDPDVVDACAYALYAHDVRASWPTANAGADPAISWRDEGPAGVTGRARYRSRAVAVLQAVDEVRRAAQ